MNVEKLINAIGAEFYTGVPDSLLQPLGNYLIKTYGTDPKKHIIAANEGNCAALAAGYHIATGKTPVVYLQNSGEGNIINPVASLMNDKVYGIPCVFVIGWRGEPGVHDEPQHVYQGEVTLRLLEDMDIAYFVITKETGEDELEECMKRFRDDLAVGKQVAFVVKKGALSFDEKLEYKNDNTVTREEAIRHIVAVSGEDVIVSTTGKASRELFEIREANGQPHKYDFLTVGSMGHSSSIALAIAEQRPDRRVWCIDGDGAALMHMGALATIGSYAPDNLIHIVINNGAHESVGGLPTVAGGLELSKLATDCGYRFVAQAATVEELDEALGKAMEQAQCAFIEIKAAIGSRADLGRPTTTARENKEQLMKYIQE